MSENSDLERYQQLLVQLRAMSNKQMACELECSRLAAENERLKHDSAKWCGDSEQIQKALGVERIVDCVPTIEKLLAENEQLKAKVARLMEITDFMNDIGFLYKVDRHGDAYIHSDDYGDFYYSRKHHDEDVR